MNLKKLNILLADDDPGGCNFFKDSLKRLPLSTQFTAVHDGEQLLQLLTNEKTGLPYVLFLNIKMPYNAGVLCVSEINKSKKMKDLPVAMFSTSDSCDTLNMIFENVADVYIHMPTDFLQLKQVIHHAVPIAAENIFSSSQIKYALNA